MAFETCTLEDRPELRDQVGQLAREGWPTFLLHSDITHWDTLFDEFAELQILYPNQQEQVLPH